MSTATSNLLSQMAMKCGSLLHELQIIWDDVGESDAERDRVLLELEQECLEVCRRKVDRANRCRAELRQAISDAEADLAAICSAMGERPVHIIQTDKNPQRLKAELRAIIPQIEEMRRRKIDRKNQFTEVLEEIQSIKNDIYGSDGFPSNDPAIDESDLSIRKLEELHRELQLLQKEKSERLKLVLDRLHCLYSLCIVLGWDFKKTASQIHLSLGEAEGSKSISNSTIEQLGTAIERLRGLKIQRMQQLQDLAASLLELWNLMDTPTEEQQIFQKVTCKLAASEDEIIEPDMLSADYVNCVKAEVFRLEEVKASKMKELVLKKKAELKVICKKTHLIPDADGEIEIAIDAIESGAVDAACVLEQVELHIARVKEEALSRKEILEKVEKWMAACEEESWLEEYNRDDNRYNAGRGAHLTLKRAEKARALVNKLPAMVDALASKVIAWENENGIVFIYDGVRLLSMLEEYRNLRQEKEQERKRQRDQKKLQGQLLAEQEALYGSKPSPVKSHTVKKARLSCDGASNRRLSMLQTPKPAVTPAKATPNTRNTKKIKHINQALIKDDGFAGFPSGRRGLDMAGVLPEKQNSPNLAATRKPFSPISSTKSSFKPNPANISEGMNRKHNKKLQHKATVFDNKTPFSTLPKITSTTDELENRTPQTTEVTVPSTPPTVSVPMQTAMTPNPIEIVLTAKPPIKTFEIPALLTIKLVDEGEIEYSFEERRARFVLPRSCPMAETQI